MEGDTVLEGTIKWVWRASVLLFKPESIQERHKFLIIMSSPMSDLNFILQSQSNHNTK